MEDSEKEELSSIILQSDIESLNQSQVNMISNELSSLSFISIKETYNSLVNTETYSPEMLSLKQKLKESVRLLQNEIKLYEEGEKADNSIRKETIIPGEDVLDQLKSIKNKIEDLKVKLKSSEDLVIGKTLENYKLKEELKCLEFKNFTSEDKTAICKSCTVL
jgi:hypothetical protein